MSKSSIKIVIIGILSLCLPVIALIINHFIPSSNVLDAVKGFLFGISFLSLMIYIPVLVQDKDTIKCNMCLAISGVIGATYTIYLTIALIFINASMINVDVTAGSILSIILSYLIVPTIVMQLTASILMIIGTVKRNYGFALAGSIIYTVSVNIPSLVLGYLGSSQIKDDIKNYDDLEEEL